ncbi:DUF3311 domain-containing protein [Nocardioides panaciterrulae]|uniref:DUF3311 domain-containing protein n=1 Tax=Nocardioides panaciterrulae TaxID=661492 RepID=A0A7Y9E2K5_9ACTN|nr:DUF3311 domain-containing protein [Nocardioides panaciterrulae]NYD40093.1 hypothetical protein [Nocardioides panaciterrulae]
MTETPPRPAGRTPRGPWILAVVLLAPAVILPLIVPLYDSTDPTLNGWPFYFWFQMALILMSGVLTIAAYLVVTRSERRERVRDGERTR